MDIMALLRERTQYPILPNRDIWLDKFANSSEDVIYIVSTDAIFRRQQLHNPSLANFFNTYHLTALFNIKNPYINISIDFCLYVLSKKPSSTICYGIYHKKLRFDPYARSLSTKNPGFVLMTTFPEDYSAYLGYIDSYLAHKTLPADTNSYEFGTFPTTFFTAECWNPIRYRKKVHEVYKALKTTTSVPLNSIVYIIRPRPTQVDCPVPTVLPRDWQYPVNYNNLSAARQTNCSLQKGDILLFNHQSVLIIYEQPPIELYAGPNCLVLRPNHADFCSEYIYYYLISEDTRTLLHSLESGLIPRIDRNALENLPIALQPNSHAFYRTKFFEENFPYSYLKTHPIDIQHKQVSFTPYSGDKEYIFISYCHKDKEHVLPIIQHLYNNGYRVWYDEGIDPGTEWDRNIAEHIESCGYFIAFMSVNYLNSSNCKDELSFARDLDKNRFLIYLEEVVLPPEMRMRLARTQNIHKYTYANDNCFYQKLEAAKDLRLCKD